MKGRATLKPIVSYEQIVKEDSAHKLDTAFDLLFEEVLKDDQIKDRDLSAHNGQIGVFKPNWQGKVADHEPPAGSH